MANTYLSSIYYLVPGTALGSAGSVVNKTDRVPILLEFRVSREDRCLTSKFGSLMEQGQVCDTLQRQSSGGRGESREVGTRLFGEPGRASLRKRGYS